jgi:hypothetical protein
MRRWMCAATGVLALSGLAVCVPVAGQAVNIDGGTFRLTVNGAEVGSETFAIVQSGPSTNATVEARGQVSLDSRPESTSRLLFAGPALRAASYDLRVRGEQGDTIKGTVSGRRVTARVVSGAGENLREYLVSEGAVVIEDGVAYQHYFLARRVREGEMRVPVIVPREGRQVWVNVQPAGEETLTIAGQPIAATRLNIRPEQGDERILWVDAQDRVLRLEIPARGYVAERTAPPV